MGPTFITITVVMVAIVLWIISIQRKVVVLDENVSNALSQIGVQLSARFDALTVLVELTRDYAKHEGDMLFETIRSTRGVVTGRSTQDDVMCQEAVISEALVQIAAITEQYPDMKANPKYIKTMDLDQSFESMLVTSHFIYNDSVSKLNREIRMFPVSIIAGMLGFHQREHLVNQSDKPNIPLRNEKRCI